MRLVLTVFVKNLQVGVRLSDGREFYARTIISNATRWDTFGKVRGGAISSHVSLHCVVSIIDNPMDVLICRKAFKS